jgi:hypothetical protein
VKRRIINIIVFVSGMLFGVSLLIWVGSYVLGLFVLHFSPTSGFDFVSVQRGTLAFCVGSIPGASARWHVWWLQPDEMFENQERAAIGRSPVMLPDEGGNVRFAVGPPHYPWRWSVTSGVYGFIPIWIFALVFAIVPVAWAAGIFDRGGPKDRLIENERSPAGRS